MENFKTVAQVGDISPGQGATFTIGDRMIAVFCSEDGYHAIDDLCPHMGASLGTGYLENGVVTCPWHAWRFRVCDGTWVDNPKLKVEAFEVRVQGDEIQVRLGKSVERKAESGEPESGARRAESEEPESGARRAESEEPD